jgi:phage baseplate assembly protein W
MAVEIQINPLDLEFDIAIGVDLPMNVRNGSGFKLNYFSIDQALANAKNLLLTDKGERVMLPEFGCDIKKSLFENITNDLLSKIDRQIRSSFAYWLPYIFITNLVITPNQDRNAVRIELTISLDPNGFDTRSITLVVSNNGQ